MWEISSIVTAIWNKYPIQTLNFWEFKVYIWVGKAFMDWLSWQLLFQYKIGLKQLNFWDQKLLQVFSAFIHSVNPPIWGTCYHSGAAFLLYPFLTHSCCVVPILIYFGIWCPQGIALWAHSMSLNAKTFVVWWRSCPKYKLFSKGLCSGLGKSHMSELYVNSHFLQGYSLLKHCHTLYIHSGD